MRRAAFWLTPLLLLSACEHRSVIPGLDGDLPEAGVDAAAEAGIDSGPGLDAGFASRRRSGDGG